MAKNRVRNTNINPAIDCVCDLCGVKGHSIPHTQHRNCNGLGRARPTTGRVPSKMGRGVWQSALEIES